MAFLNDDDEEEDNDFNYKPISKALPVIGAKP